MSVVLKRLTLSANTDPTWELTNDQISSIIEVCEKWLTHKSGIKQFRYSEIKFLNGDNKLVLNTLEEIYGLFGWEFDEDYSYVLEEVYNVHPDGVIINNRLEQE